MKRALVMTVAAVLLSCAATASAINTELVLVIDGSGSISTADWSTMLNGYADAISNAGIVPQDGSVSVGVVQFASAAQMEIPLTTITGANAGTLAAAIQGITQLTGVTNISAGITLGETLLSDAFLGNQIIDVSTDGQHNQGGPTPLEAAMAAVDTGNADVVNVIGIGAATNYDFDYGTNSFNLYVSDFDGFGDAIAQKIEREITPTIPAPGALLLAHLGVGLVGWMRSRRAL